MFPSYRSLSTWKRVWTKRQRVKMKQTVSRGFKRTQQRLHVCEVHTLLRLERDTIKITISFVIEFFVSPVSCSHAWHQLSSLERSLMVHFGARFCANSHLQLFLWAQCSLAHSGVAGLILIKIKHMVSAAHESSNSHILDNDQAFKDKVNIDKCTYGQHLLSGP